MKFKDNAKLATLGLDNTWMGGPPSNFRFCWYYSGNLGTNCGLYYKPMMIVNDDSRVINKLEA